MDEYAQQRNTTNRRELADRIATALPKDGFVEPIPGVRLTRISETIEKVYSATRPALCLIAQGAKEVYLGDHRYRHDAEHYLLVTFEMPVKTIIFAESRDRPYLALRFDIDAAEMSSLVEFVFWEDLSPGDSKVIGVSRLDSDLLDAATRLVRLFDSPENMKVLIPLAKQEVLYRLLLGEQGHRLRHLFAPSGHSQLIAQALERLRSEFDHTLRIKNLARELGMSSTRFYHHFKLVTDMSPLQFQKQLRLREARRLMFDEDFDAATAGYHVGYKDASQFSRDYKRHFGYSPKHDVERLRFKVTANEKVLD